MLQIVLYALAFAIMLMLLWFTMVFSPPFTGDCKALSLSTPPPPGDRWCDTSLALCSIDSSVRLTRGLPLNRPSLLLFVSITASWSRLWGLSTALKYALTCLSDLHWWEISMNRMVSAGMPFVVPSMTLIAWFCILSNFSRFVCDIVVGPCP